MQNEFETNSKKNKCLQLETTRIVVFKDGYCMFIKRGIGKLDSMSKTIIEKIPETMILGSFWVIPEKEKLISVIAKQQILSRKTQQETKKRFVLEFVPEAAGKNISLSILYFGPGIRWIPTYRVSLEDKNQCFIMMQAEILNEAEDFENVPINLIVGVPNFRFKEVISPLTLEPTLRNFLKDSAPQLMGQQAFSNVLMSQRSGEVHGRHSHSDSYTTVPTLPPELSGEGSQDLFIYKIPKLSLNAGERAAIPLISAKQSFKHIYTWDVHLSRSSVDSLPGGGIHVSPVKLIKNEVWHQIELVNQTSVPWTTGAALIMEEFLPVAQELLTYTSIGGKLRIPLSVAIDIRGTYSEKEIGRDVNAIRFDRDDYVKITKKGTLRVTNYKKELIEILITCELGGNVDNTSRNGQISISDFRKEDWTDFRGAKALTGHSTINWTLQLASEETKELTCEYHYYIR